MIASLVVVPVAPIHQRLVRNRNCTVTSSDILHVRSWGQTKTGLKDLLNVATITIPGGEVEAERHSH